MDTVSNIEGENSVKVIETLEMLLFVLLLAILQIKIVEMFQETNGFVMKNELPTVQINLESFFSSQNGGWCWDASDDARKNLLTFWLQTIQEVPEKIFGTERGSKINKFHVFFTKRNTIASWRSSQSTTLNVESNSKQKGYRHIDGSCCCFSRQPHT